jgi:hypothetical protein
MAPPQELSCRTLILVEGKTDQPVLDALCRSLNMSSFDVRTYEGKDSLREFLHVVQNVRGFRDIERLVVIRDADNSVNAAFRSVCAALQQEKFAVPRKPARLRTGKPSVSVIIVPHDRPGALETILMQAVDEPAIDLCVDAFVACFRAHVRHKLSPGQLAKARAQAFLATRPKPGLSSGDAARSGVWAITSPAFDRLRRALQDAT